MDNTRKGTFLDKVTDFFGSEAWDNIDQMVLKLDKYQNMGIINAEEHDALRHYLGVGSLAEQYGSTVAWIIGAANEQLNNIIPGEAGEQSRIDMKNNNLGLKHWEEGTAVTIDDLKTIDDIRNLLDVLVLI